MTNDAAERLRQYAPLDEYFLATVNRALAAERHATVERIRADVGPVNDAPEEWDARDERRRTHTILDKEANR
jgi:hypothetical protein